MMSLRHAIPLAALLAAASSPTMGVGEAFPTPDSKAMEFRLALTGDCPDCRFVAAEGPIVGSTPDDFMAFIAALPDNNAVGLTVHFNSAGGDPAAAIRLGDLIRLQGMNTAVARTVGEVGAAASVVVATGKKEESKETATAAPGGLCAGACILAFAGGIQRMAATTTPPAAVHGQQLGALLVHEIPLADVAAAGPAGSEGQGITVRDLLDYLTRMGVSAELVQMFLIVPDSSPVEIDDPRLQRLSLDNRMPARADLVGYRNGVAVLEIDLERPTGQHAIELYCEKGQVKILATVQWATPVDQSFAEDLGLYEAMKMPDGSGVKRESAEYSTEGSGTTARVRLTIEGLKPAALPAVTGFAFSDVSGLDAGRVARDLSFELPADFEGLSLLARHCL